MSTGNVTPTWYRTVRAIESILSKYSTSRPCQGAARKFGSGVKFAVVGVDLGSVIGNGSGEQPVYAVFVG